MRRRYPALVLAVAAFVAVIATARTTQPADSAVYSVAAQGWMPRVTADPGLTETWFCPGVPATGGDVHGELTIANRGSTRLEGTVLVVNDARQNVRLELEVEGWSHATIDLDQTLPGNIVGAVVEVEVGEDGGGALVEQTSYQPGGDSSTACATATSDEWYLADGFTVEGSTDALVLTNPGEQTVVVDVSFVTREGPRSPNRYSGLTIAPRSVRVLDLGAPGAGAQSEPLLAVHVEASQGRLVVGRSQTFRGGGRAGTQVSLAQPALREQWWFAGSHFGDGRFEEYVIYNPTANDVQAEVVVLGVPSVVPADPVPVPARSVVTFNPGVLDGMPVGPYAVVFATLADRSVVVERVTTQNTDDGMRTTVLAGATSRPSDGYLPSTWHITQAPEVATEDAIVIHNANNVEGTVSVFAVGASGPAPVPSLQNLTLPASQMLSLDLTDPVALGRTLIVETENWVVVETMFPSGEGASRSAAWAIPQG
ncbi:MAG TPA: DUF5719 family protein [Ilumatobacter sp.]|nr:DUF5719 family protein [Ilumatobacter sp.]